MDWSLLGKISDVIAVGTFIAAVWALWKKHSVPPALLVTVSLCIGIFIGRVVSAREWQQRSISVAVPIQQTYNGSADIQSNYFKYSPPASISLKGTFSGISDREDIWIYVLAADQRYYLRPTIKKENDNTWISVGTLDIGDKNKFGGEYTVGILLAEKGKCIETNKAGISVLPSCATIVKEASVQRN